MPPKKPSPDQERVAELERQLAEANSRYEVLKSEHKARADQSADVVRLTGDLERLQISFTDLTNAHSKQTEQLAAVTLERDTFSELVDDLQKQIAEHTNPAKETDAAHPE